MCQHEHIIALIYQSTHTNNLSQIFCHWKSLIYLVLRNIHLTNISSIDMDTTTSYSNLLYLDLSHNKLTHVSNNQFLSCI
jgi:Leucine-rich repeat (LRR) protein